MVDRVLVRRALPSSFWGWSWVALLLALIFGGACGSTASVDPARLEAEQRRLLGPFAASRAVVCDRLEIEISPNFDPEVTRPAAHPQLHQLEQKKLPEFDEYRWRNLSGGLQAPLKFIIGNTGLVAMQEAVLRVYLKRTDLRLTALASGNVDLAEQGPIRKLSEVRIADGSLQGR